MAPLTTTYIDGVRTPASVLRANLFASTKGGEGVVLPGQLAVTALAVPGGAVNVAPGTAVMNNRYAAGLSGESYSVSNPTTVQVPITATGSTSGRTDYLILRVDDWTFDSPGNPPADPNNVPGAHFAIVPSIANLTYPFYHLATITIPASTGTITNAMISNPRKILNPQSDSKIITVTGISSDPETKLTVIGGTGEIFPGVRLAMQSLDIPSWATRMQVKCTWTGVLYAASINPFGRYWLEWGDTIGSSVKEFSSDTIRFDSPGGTASRNVWVAGLDQPIPEKHRGKTVAIWAKARYDSAGVHAAGVSLDYMGAMIWEIKYLQSDVA